MNPMEIFEEIDIILASGSPRRKELLTQTGLPFRVKTSDTKETFPRDMAKILIPEFLATKKAEAVKKEAENSLIIAADTMVLLDNKILDKPKNRQEAIFNLKKLSGAAHQVITGVCLTYKEEQKTFSASTTVFFKRLSREIVEYYVDEYQPMDKAGGYGIQEWIGLIGIDRIEGDYFNVVGLPVSRLLVELFKLKRHIDLSL